jgi:hypothetical protein
MIKTKLLTLVVIASAACLAITGVAQTTTDALIEAVKKVDDQERDAVLRSDIAQLEKLWSPAMIVNNPQSRISPNRDAVLELVEKGAIKYRVFERNIEAVRLNGDLAIVMGSELVEPFAPNAKAGHRLTRRFTNIWRLAEGNWRLIARHANLVPGS